MSKVFQSMRIAFRALRVNKLRSILTMLGIIIGVGAVIAMVSIGSGAAADFCDSRFARATNPDAAAFEQLARSLHRWPSPLH